MLIVALIAGCGSSGDQADRGAVATATAPAATTTVAPPPAATTATAHATAGRFDVGIATAAAPAGWEVADSPKIRALRLALEKVGDLLDAPFLLFRDGADPEAPNLPRLSIEKGSNLGDVSGTFDAQRRAAAAAKGFELRGDTTLDGAPAFVVEGRADGSGPTGVVGTTFRILRAPYRGETYVLSVTVRGASIGAADAAALEALRASWSWRSG